MKIVRTAWVACAATFLASTVAPEGDASAAQTAAAIEYDVVAAPAGLRADFVAPAGVSLRFLAIKTLDSRNRLVPPQDPE